MLPGGGTFPCEVACVVRLSEALERISSGGVDMLLLDLGLPDSQGLPTLSAIRRQAIQLPIIVLTGNSDERLALGAIHEGAQDYLVKGQINRNLLERSIKYALERGRAEQSLLVSEAKYRQLHESMRDAFARFDMSGRFVESNGVLLKMLGYSEAELGRLTNDEITPARWHAEEAGIIQQQVPTRGYSEVFEKEYLCKAGTLWRPTRGMPCRAEASSASA